MPHRTNRTPRMLTLAVLALGACSGTIAGTGPDDQGGNSGSGGAGNRGTDNPGVGNLGGGIDVMVEPPPIPEPEVRFACDTSQLPIRNAIRRLSHVEYTNTVKALTGRFADGNVMWSALSDTIRSRVPDDAFDPVTPHHLIGANFQELDQNEGQTHVDGFFSVAQQFATLATANATRLASLAGACATDNNAGNDATCLSDFIKNFGTLVLRRAPNNAETQFFTTVVTDGGKTPGIPVEGLRDLVTVLLSSPDFLWQIEISGSVDNGVYQLSPNEKAARLSYLFWQSPPDATLLEAAAAGNLATPDATEAMARTMLADARFTPVWDRFTRQWLKLDKLPHPENQVGKKSYDLLRGDLKPTVDLRNHVGAEVTALLSSSARKGGIGELFTSRESFVQQADLAAIYGVQPWDGKGTPPQLPEERSGLLTRVAMVMTDSLATRPIMKGVFVRRNILCDSLADPPADIDRNAPPQLMAPYSVRQAVVALTETRGQCSGCHSSINPIGFATENFDSLGRSRTVERQISVDGILLGEVPVDSHTTPMIFEDDPRTVDDGVGLQKIIATSNKTPACFARQFGRFAARAAEDDTANGCALEAMRLTLASGRPLGDAWIALTRDPSFSAYRRAN
jgi:Protein of unknown function (DUF1592)/Protein of unknown function (DUF1588)